LEPLSLPLPPSSPQLAGAGNSCNFDGHVSGQESFLSASVLSAPPGCSH